LQPQEHFPAAKPRERFSGSQAAETFSGSQMNIIIKTPISQLLIDIGGAGS